MLVKRSRKNQIALPKALLERAGVGPNDVYFSIAYKAGAIILKPVVIQHHGERLKRIREKIRALGMTERDIDAAIR